GIPLGKWWLPEDRSLDVAAVRFVTMPDPRAAAETLRGIPWSPFDLGLELDAAHPELTVALPEGTFDRVALAVDLWDGGTIEDAQEPAPPAGSPVRAGRDASEWIIGCAGLPTRHARAEVLETRTVPM